jgi:multisubunit Na+/H+ antiporter MnhE subunit
MSTSPLKEFDYFIAWIIFNSAALIGGAILGAIGGAAIGVVLTVMGVSKEMIVIAGAIVGFILGLPVSYLCFRLIVDKFIVQKIQPPALVKP